jgi:hypothetical protein
MIELAQLVRWLTRARLRNEPKRECAFGGILLAKLVRCDTDGALEDFGKGEGVGIADGVGNLHQATLPPNTHWRNWPDGGSLWLDSAVALLLGTLLLL